VVGWTTISESADLGLSLGAAKIARGGGGGTEKCRQTPHGDEAGSF